MEFGEIVVKDTPGLCRCCLSEGCYKDLGTEYPWMEETEVYADMLLECFDVSISQHNEGPNGPNRLICEVCITRLRDACNFKKQVLDSEKKFIDMVGRGAFKTKVLLYPEQMKSESEEVATDEAEIEYLEEEVDYDDIPLNELAEPSVSEDITVATLPVAKRGRPRKTVKTEKKKKIEEKTKTKNKGLKPNMASEALSESLSVTKLNRLVKMNAITVLQYSTVVPFKWHRHDYLCFYCHKNFKRIQDLKEHVTIHRESNVKSAVSYLKRDERVKIDISGMGCNICDENFNDLDRLIDHLTMKHDKRFIDGCGYGLIPYRLSDDKYVCAFCMRDFQYFIKLNQHMNEHYDNYVCDICGKSFLSKDRLRCHLRSHGSGFQCSMCPGVFDSLTQKVKHESLTHNRKRSIKCNFCPQTFDTYNLRKNHHSAVHNVAMSMANCPVCGKKFHIASKMWSHMKEVHVKEKNFSCSLCDQRFFSRTHVQKHMIKHIGEKVHQCDVCKKSYARKQTLRDHMRIHHDDKKHVCSICDRAFVQNNSLRLHVKVHHSE